MNRRGFTLVEVLIASTLFLITIASFGAIIRASSRYLEKTKIHTGELYSQRSEMERARNLPFDQLPAACSAQLKIVPLSVDLYFIQAGKLCTLRSRY